MKVIELIEKLKEYDLEAEVRLLGYIGDDDEKDDYIDYIITDVHDLFIIKDKGDMVSLEFCRETGPVTLDNFDMEAKE